MALLIRVEAVNLVLVAVLAKGADLSVVVPRVVDQVKAVKGVAVVRADKGVRADRAKTVARVAKFTMVNPHL